MFRFQRMSSRCIEKKKKERKKEKKKYRNTRKIIFTRRRGRRRASYRSPTDGDVSSSPPWYPWLHRDGRQGRRGACVRSNWIPRRDKSAVPRNFGVSPVKRDAYFRARSSSPRSRICPTEFRESTSPRWPKTNASRDQIRSVLASNFVAQSNR